MFVTAYGGGVSTPAKYGTTGDYNPAAAEVAQMTSVRGPYGQGYGNYQLDLHGNPVGQLDASIQAVLNVLVGGGETAAGLATAFGTEGLGSPVALALISSGLLKLTNGIGSIIQLESQGGPVVTDTGRPYQPGQPVTLPGYPGSWPVTDISGLPAAVWAFAESIWAGNTAAEVILAILDQTYSVYAGYVGGTPAAPGVPPWGITSPGAAPTAGANAAAVWGAVDAGVTDGSTYGQLLQRLGTMVAAARKGGVRSSDGLWAYVWDDATQTYPPALSVPLFDVTAIGSADTLHSFLVSQNPSWTVSAGAQVGMYDLVLSAGTPHWHVECQVTPPLFEFMKHYLYTPSSGPPVRSLLGDLQILFALIPVIYS